MVEYTLNNAQDFIKYLFLAIYLLTFIRKLPLNETLCFFIKFEKQIDGPGAAASPLKINKTFSSVAPNSLEFPFRVSLTLGDDKNSIYIALTASQLLNSFSP